MADHCSQYDRPYADIHDLQLLVYRHAIFAAPQKLA